MRFRALVVALGLGGGVFLACTTFDGLSAQKPEQSPPPTDSGHPDTSIVPDATQKQTTFLGIEDAVRICALAIKCPQFPKSIQSSLAIPLDTLNFSLCVDWLAGPVPPTRIGVALEATELGCVAKGKTCIEALSCISQEFLEDTDTRCLGLRDAGPDAKPGTYEYCDDSGAVVRCDAEFLHDILHCSSGYYAPSSRCTVGSDGTKTCATGINCSAAPSCRGSLLDFCAFNATHQGQNCAIEGFTCGLDVTDDSGTPTCLTSDRVEACTAQTTDCEGNAASVCDGFTRSLYDCAALGGTCTKAAGTARCKRDSDTCAPEDPAVNQCTGTIVSLCIGGAPTTFDCATVGLQCVPGAASASGHCG
jgi:hypothetical protein